MTTTHLLLPALFLPPLPSVSTQQAECWKQKADHINPLRKALRTFPLLRVFLRCPSRGCPVRLSVISLTSSPAPPLTLSAPLASLPRNAPGVPIFEFAISSAWNLLFPLPRHLHGLLTHLLQVLTQITFPEKSSLITFAFDICNTALVFSTEHPLLYYIFLFKKYFIWK